MMTAREDDLESRMRFLESEMAGEKIVTRHILEKTQRNANEIAAVRVDIACLDSKIDCMAADITLINAAQISQGSMLNILVQDVRQMRMDMTQMRAEMRTEIGQVRSELRTEIGEMRTEIDEVRSEIGQVRSEMDARFNAVDARFDAVLAAIRAIAPHAPPAT
jgi:hypothetical protein